MLKFDAVAKELAIDDGDGLIQRSGTDESVMTVLVQKFVADVIKGAKAKVVVEGIVTADKVNNGVF